jgi:hypothetical protein
MAEVTGHIGDQYVTLNNAASEATLKMLLQSSLAANKQNVDQLKKLVKDGGIFDAAAMERVNSSMGSLSSTVDTAGSKLKEFGYKLERMQNFLIPFGNALGKISDGTGAVSDVLGAFKGLPLGIGIVASAFSSLAKFQEDNLAAYQKLTEVGINFGGSLTQLRSAMGQTYLTMDQFNKLMSENSPVFARLGATADQGTRAFIKISGDLNNSKAGDYLRSLGFTAEDLNQGLARTLSISGSASRMDLANRQQLVQATVEYMDELDKLTKFTGASRKQIEEEDKKAALNAAYQRKLASLDPNAAARVEATRSAAAMSGVKGAADLVMSSFLNLPPATKEAETLTGTFGQAANSLSNTVRIVQNSSATMEDVNKGFGNFSEGIRQTSKGYGDGVLMFSQGPLKDVLNSSVLYATTLEKKGVKGIEDYGNMLKSAEGEQGKQRTSEAAAQADMQKKLFEARVQLNEAISRLANESMPYIKKVLEMFTTAVNWATGQISKAPEGLISKFIEYAIYLGVAIAGLKILGTGLKLAGGAGKFLSGGAASETALGRAPGSVLKGGAGGAIEGELAGAARAGSSVLRALPGIGSLAVAGFALKDYFDIEKKRKQGEITAEKAKREETKLVGETGGGLGGALAGAATGSVFGPIGTLVGGIVGGVAGSKIGKDIADSLTTEDKKKEDTKIEEAVKSTPLPQDVPSKDLLEGVNRLNTTMIALLSYMKATASNTERTYRDMENLKNKVW